MGYSTYHLLQEHSSTMYFPKNVFIILWEVEVKSTVCMPGAMFATVQGSLELAEFAPVQRRSTEEKYRGEVQGRRTWEYNREAPLLGSLELEAVQRSG